MFKDIISSPSILGLNSIKIREEKKVENLISKKTIVIDESDQMKNRTID